MSTRATYEFISADGDAIDSRTFIYVHYDNYPQGAAVYLYNTLINPSKGNFATQFIRANEMAEITKSHEWHGDTDYRYVIKGYGPKAKIKCFDVSNNWDTGDKVIKLVFDGYVCDFIESNKDMIDNYHSFIEVPTKYGPNKLMNLEVAEKYLNSEFGPLSNLRSWKGRMEGSSNWESCVYDVSNMVKVFPQLITNEIRELIGEECR